MITAVGLSAALDVTYLVDAVRLGAIHRPHGVLSVPGGKALNVARAALALGTEVRALVPTGGHTGARVRDGLAQLGVEAPLIESDAETRLCVTVIGDDGAAPTEFYERAPDVSDAAWAAVRREAETLVDGWLAVSGSLPDERIADTTELLAEATARGIPVALDTHGRALAEIVRAAPPALVKVNRHEAEALLGVGDAAALARRLADRGVRIAVVTDGPHGAVAAIGGELWRATPPSAGRYAVGSGDSFLAGLLVGLGPEAAGSLPDALRLSTAAAAANTLAPGAALFALDDVRRIAAAVTLTRLDAGGERAS
jgi:1-phosphofructokinase family hexose kinase